MILKALLIAQGQILILIFVKLRVQNVWELIKTLKNVFVLWTQKILYVLEEARDQVADAASCVVGTERHGRRGHHRAAVHHLVASGARRNVVVQPSSHDQGREL